MRSLSLLWRGGLCALMLCVLPGSVHAQALGVGFLGLGLTLLPHFAGIVLNVPGVPGSIMSAGALPTFPPPGVYSFWYPVGPGCLNGVQEVNLTPLAVGTPVVMLQGVGAYTFPWGPAMHPGQKIIGKYLPTMVCIAPFVSWVYCGLSLCPVVTPLPFFFAPLIIYNGSTP